MIGNGQETENQNRDIILRSREDGIQQISEIHRAYAALHYDISEFSDENELNTSDKKSISAMNYVSYRLQVGRPEEAITLHYYGRLFQQ
ncbi:hypothetical protein TRAVEDRAFT_147095 [Rhizophagus irregularis DAOM 181602=DAOM 197198]|uniref:Uncharacterized protein n=1 Tax=Rhizophagus irregularis (strain DAOM 197198w) TaxID=1432141 RepID=A0A015K6G9_RHIIW|nr:hypothetical protein RirG_024360 [Rhizophagus irregularis DAOM 197198w]GBC42224.1 hypothetical protein TRAVEDRAFT_147095 [Rhizophagus irregularis DAOM 181602=DAOM 197198]